MPIVIPSKHSAEGPTEPEQPSNRQLRRSSLAAEQDRLRVPDRAARAPAIEWNRPHVVERITLALDEKTLEARRAYAERHQTTLNALVRELLARTTVTDRQAVISEMFRLMDAYPGHSRGQRWTREELDAR